MAEGGLSQSWRIGNRNGVTHGYTIGGVPPEYATWKGMRRRCSTEQDPRWPLYGGRGIRVCERWNSSFAAFIADVGPRPSRRHSLDRIDVNGDYEPGNVRWATQTEQCRNKRTNHRIEYAGRTWVLSELANSEGIEASLLRYHLKAGKSADEAVAFIKVRQGKPNDQCFAGHKLAGDNLYLSPRGHPQCRACRKAARLRSRQKLTAANP